MICETALQRQFGDEQDNTHIAGINLRNLAEWHTTDSIVNKRSLDDQRFLRRVDVGHLANVLVVRIRHRHTDDKSAFHLIQINWRYLD